MSSDRRGPTVPTLENLVTHPRFFGLSTATPTQRAICRALDGLPLGELAAHPDVIAAFGGVDSLASLPTTPPLEMHVIASIRSAKSLIAAAHIVRQSQTVDASRCTVGDIIRHFVLALKLDGTRAVMNHLTAHLLTKPALRSLVVRDARGELQCGPERVILRHPSGMHVEVVPVPLDRAGGSVLSVFSAGITVDEEPRMLGATDAVKNLDDVRDGVMGRLLPGAQYLGIGSPHAPSGPVFKMYEESFGQPSADLVIAQAPGPAMNPSWWTLGACEKMRDNPRTARAYRTDVLAQFADGEASVFPSDQIRDAVRVLESTADFTPVMALDMASGRGDAAVAIPVAWVRPRLAPEAYLWTQHRARTVMSTDDRGMHWYSRVPLPDLNEHGEPLLNPAWDGERHPIMLCGEPLAFDGRFARDISFDTLVSRVAAYCHRVGALFVVGDQHLEYSLAAEFRRHGLRFKSLAWSAPTKEAAVDRLRLLFRDRRIVIPDDAALRRELANFAEKPRPSGGYSYEARGRGHDDRVMALALASAADIEGMLPGSPVCLPSGKRGFSLEARQTRTLGDL